MKKFLSLVLALIMTMSLVTVSAGAKDFTDDESLTYDEAVAVMSEIGVIDGYPDGTFKPQNGLTRGAAAKIICNMILGPTTASALRADTAPFKDVAVDNQYAGYIAYCVQQGITSGYTDGTYRPAAPLTSFAFMKMLLGALGYDQNTEGYVGANCFINVAKQAIGLGLDAGLKEEFNGGKQITREEAALFAFNTLKATMVEYTEKTTVTVGGAEVVLSGNARDVEWGTAKLNDGNIKPDGFVQFAEKHFPKLVLTNDQDAFGRPANTWTFNKDEIDTFVNNNLLVAEFTKKVEGDEMYKVIGAKALEDFDLYAYIDGEDSVTGIADCAKAVEEATFKKSEETILKTDNGVLTQVFVDLDNEDIYVVTINTYLAFAAADYNKSKDSLTIEAWSYNLAAKEWDDDAASTIKLSGEDYDVEDYEEGDAMLVTIASGVVQDIMEPEIKEDCTVTQFSTKKGDNQASKATKVTFDGESYNYNHTAQYKDDVLYVFDGKLLTDKTYNFFLDQYGYVIGAEEASSDDQYVFVTAIDYLKSNLLNATAEASVIFTDGTQDNITIKVKATNDKIEKADKLANGNNVTDSGIYKQLTTNNINVGDSAAAWNTWYTYTVKDGVYTLAPVVRQGHQVTTDDNNATTDDAAKINSAKNTLINGNAKTDTATLANSAVGNSKSVYITVDTALVNTVKAVDDVTSVTTGIRAVDLSVPANGTDATRGVYFLWDSKNYVIAAIVVGDDNAVTKDFVYVLDKTANYEKKVESDYFWEFDAIVDGEKSSVVEIDTVGWSQISATADGKARDYGMLRLSKNNDGYVVDAEDVTGKSYTVNDLSLIVRDTTKIVEMLAVETAAQAPATTAILREKADALYVNDEYSKNGLVMAEDVKIVVIDDGEVDDSVANLKSALSIVDADLDTAECQFNGDVVAVLNKNGEAAILILNSTTDRPDPTNPGSGSTTTSIRFKRVDVVNNMIYLDKRDNAGVTIPKVEAAAKAALASVGYKATTGVTAALPYWTIGAVNMNSANTTVFTFGIDWE